MSGEIFVGNLPHAATEAEIKHHFSPVGNVISVHLMTDRKGRSRCFGFINVDNPDEAVDQLNEKEFQGRKLRIAKAVPRQAWRPMHQRRFRH